MVSDYLPPNAPLGRACELPWARPEDVALIACHPAKLHTPF